MAILTFRSAQDATYALREAAAKLVEDKDYQNAVGDERRGMEIVLRALERPMREIAQNAGKDGNEALAEAAKKGAGYGYDAARGEYVKMIEAGIIEPLKVVKSALETAASIASLILITEAAVAEIPEKKEPMPGGGMPPGGMGEYD